MALDSSEHYLLHIYLCLVPLISALSILNRCKYLLFPIFDVYLQIPKFFGAETTQSTKVNPFPLPEIYLASQKRIVSVILEIYGYACDALLWLDYLTFDVYSVNSLFQLYYRF